MLARALDSVCKQTRPADAVCVAVDRDHEGEWTTRNRTLAMADTEYVAFLDDDDELLPQHLDALMARASKGDVDLVYPWFVWRDDDNIHPNHEPVGFGRDFDAERLRGENFIPVTYLVRTELARFVGGFPAPGHDDCPGVMTDWGFLLRLLKTNARIVHVPERTWVWNRWSGNLASAVWR